MRCHTTAAPFIGLTVTKTLETKENVRSTRPCVKTPLEQDNLEP